MVRARRLNPRPPAWYYWLQGEAEYAARQYEQAIATLRRESTYGTPSRSILAAALAQLGRIEEAMTEGRLFMADYPSFRIEPFLNTQPFRNPACREHFADGYPVAFLLATASTKYSNLLMILLLLPFWTSTLTKQRS